MKWWEFVGIALRYGATFAEVVRERRRKGDTRKASEIWREVKSERDRRESYDKTRRKFGIKPEGEK